MFNIEKKKKKKKKTGPGMKTFLFTRKFHPGIKRVEFHPGMKFNLKQRKPSIDYLN